MKILKFTLTLITTFVVSLSFGQGNISFGGAGGAVSQLVIPQLYDDKLASGKTTEDVQFFSYPYVSSKVDVRNMKSRFPGLRINNFIEIIPPDVNRFNDVSLLMGVFDYRTENPALIIWVVGNYESNEATFFIDEYNDHNFLNDKEPVVIEGGQDPVKVEIYPYGEGSLMREMWIAIPKQKKKKLAKVKKEKTKLLNQLSVGPIIGFSSAEIFWERPNNNVYNGQSGFANWYDVDLLEKEIGLNVNYNLRFLRLGITGTYQNINQYTSFFTEQFGPRERVRSGNTIVVRENTSSDPNLDLHSSNRFKLVGNVGIRLHLGTYVEVQPTVGFGYIYYLNGEYIANKFSEPQTSFTHKKDEVLDIGLRFEFTTGYKTAFFFGANFTSIFWDPEGYFNSLPTQVTESYYRSWNGFVGMHFSL